MFSWNRLHPGVKAVFFVQIVNRMGDFVVPFLTLILTQVQGFTPAMAGLVVSLATALGSFGGLLAGRISDRHGRRDTLVVFLGTSGVLLAGAGFAPAHIAAAAAMVAAGFFTGAMRPVLGALVGDLTDSSTRRTAFSLSYLGINLGVAVGPLAAGWLFHHALSWMFWLDGLSTVAALVILVRYVPRDHRPLDAASPGTKKPASSWKTFVSHPTLFPFALLYLTYNFVYAQMMFTQALQLVDLFGTEGPQLFGLVWAVNALTVIILTPVVLRFTRTWTNLRSMTLAMVLVALGISAYLFRPGEALVLGAALVWSAGEVLFSTHSGDFITGQSPSELRGRFQGYVGFCSSLGILAAPVISGLVTQVWGLGGVWWLAVATEAGVAVGFYLLGRKVRALGSPAAATP